MRSTDPQSPRPQTALPGLSPAISMLRAWRFRTLGGDGASMIEIAGTRSPGQFGEWIGRDTTCTTRRHDNDFDGSKGLGEVR
jgi:hypothetical protein